MARTLSFHREGETVHVFDSTDETINKRFPANSILQQISPNADPDKRQISWVSKLTGAILVPSITVGECEITHASFDAMDLWLQKFLQTKDLVDFLDDIDNGSVGGLYQYKMNFASTYNGASRLGGYADTDAATLFQFIGGPNQYFVESSDATDGGLGVGANTVRLYGIDFSGNYAYTEIGLNGLTQVMFPDSLSYPFAMRVTGAGQNRSNVGVLTLKSPTNVPMFEIEAGHSISKLSLLAVASSTNLPTGKVASIVVDSFGGNSLSTPALGDSISLNTSTSSVSKVRDRIGLLEGYQTQEVHNVFGVSEMFYIGVTTGLAINVNGHMGIQISI